MGHLIGLTEGTPLARDHRSPDTRRDALASARRGDRSLIVDDETWLVRKTLDPVRESRQVGAGRASVRCSSRGWCPCSTLCGALDRALPGAGRELNTGRCPRDEQGPRVGFSVGAFAKSAGQGGRRRGRRPRSQGMSRRGRHSARALPDRLGCQPMSAGTEHLTAGDPLHGGSRLKEP